jgi:hypothetical protein
MSSKHTWHIGGVHSNFKFGIPAPRTGRQAFGHDVSFRSSKDGLVFVVVMLCFAIGLLVAR